MSWITSRCRDAAGRGSAMVCCEPSNGLRHRDPRTIPGCRWGSLACRPQPAARRIAVELAPSPRDRERRRAAVVRRRARAGRGHVVAPPRRAASPRTRGLARRSHGRCARGDIGDGDDGGSVGAASGCRCARPPAGAVRPGPSFALCVLPRIALLIFGGRGDSPRGFPASGMAAACGTDVPPAAAG